MRAAIVLAAGRSERFGRTDKLFATLDGAPLLLHAIRVARAAPAGRVIVVAGARAAYVRALVRRAGLREVSVVRVRAIGAPLSTSLRAGLAALRPVERDVFVFLGDMPGVDPDIAGRLARRLRPGLTLARPRHSGVPGHPVLIRNVRSAAGGSGDMGFGALHGAIAWREEGRSCIVDVDRHADLTRLRRGRR